jgi:hypothetical protein
MNEGTRRGRLLPQRVDVRHDVVAEAALVLRGEAQVGIIEVLAQLLDGALGNREPQLALRLQQSEPEAAPESHAMRLTPKRLHGRRRIAAAERRLPAAVAHRPNTRSVKMVIPERSK